MKHAYKLLSILFLMMAFAIPFTSCSDDKDDEPADPATHDKELVGTWEISYNEDGEYGIERYIFRSNGTGRYEEIFDGYEDYWEEFEWDTESGYLTVDYTSSSEEDMIGTSDTMQYKVRGNSLYINGENSDPYIKK